LFARSLRLHSASLELAHPEEREHQQGGDLRDAAATGRTPGARKARGT